MGKIKAGLQPPPHEPPRQSQFLTKSLQRNSTRKGQAFHCPLAHILQQLHHRKHPSKPSPSSSSSSTNPPHNLPHL